MSYPSRVEQYLTTLHQLIELRECGSPPASQAPLRESLEAQFELLSDEERSCVERVKKRIAERDAALVEIERLRASLLGYSTPREETCVGNCSRGGDGPACRKKGCNG